MAARQPPTNAPRPPFRATNFHTGNRIRRIDPRKISDDPARCACEARCAMPQTQTRLPQPGDWSTFDDLTALQEQRLPHALRQATRSPFYQRLFGDAELPGTVA